MVSETSGSRPAGEGVSSDGTRTILVVEDDPAIAGLLVVLLESDGYAVDIAPDGETAVQYCTRARPDAIFLDVTLPDRSGWDVLAHLRASGDLPPVLLLTGDSAAVRRARSSELVEVLQKPFDIDDLLAAARRLVRA